jgi:hypothetical protein
LRLADAAFLVGTPTRREGTAMASAVLIVTAAESSLGFLVAGTILYLIVSRGRKPYHYVFAAFVLICATWDLGIFLMMIRNQHAEELDAIGRIAVLPCLFIPALIFHFANLYTGRPIRWALILVWSLTGLTWVPILAGVFYRIEGIYSYPWGNMFRVAPTVVDPMAFVFWFGINLWAGWLLWKGAQRATAPLERRHYLYILAGTLAVTLAIVKALSTMGIDVSFLLPLGMFLNDVFAAIIGIAIVKDRLLDITVIVKKGSLYSVLAVVLVFVYSFAEHILITYVGEAVGEKSVFIHLAAIAAGIAVLMPIKSRLEAAIDRYFAHRELAF